MFYFTFEWSLRPKEGLSCPKLKRGRSGGMNEWEEFFGRSKYFTVERLLCARRRAVLAFPPVIFAAALSAAPRFYRLVPLAASWESQFFSLES